MMKFEERRRFARMAANCAMTFKRAVGKQVHEGVCINISGAGILFEAEMGIELGKALEIRTLPVDRITPPITAFIEVTRCTQAESKRYHIAGVIKGIKSE